MRWQRVAIIAVINLRFNDAQRLASGMSSRFPVEFDGNPIPQRTVGVVGHDLTAEEFGRIISRCGTSRQSHVDGDFADRRQCRLSGRWRRSRDFFFLQINVHLQFSGRRGWPDDRPHGLGKQRLDIERFPARTVARRAAAEDEQYDRDNETSRHVCYNSNRPRVPLLC